MKDKLNILVAFDGSSQAMEAVRYVSRFFSADNTAVNIFHVAVEVPETFLDLGGDIGFYNAVVPAHAWTCEVKKNMEAALTKAGGILHRAGFADKAVKTTYHSRKVGVARDIMAESKKRYDALVLGRSGVSRLKDVVVGTIANKLVSTSGHLPLIVVGGRPGVDKVLIGFDGSDDAMRAVESAGNLMVSAEREVMLCHVVRSLNAYLSAEGVFNAKEEKQWLAESRKAIAPALDAAQNRLIESGFYPAGIYKQVLEDKKSRSAGLVRAAREGDFGSIVVGRRGHSRIREFVMGRVSRKVLHMGRDLAVWVV